MKKTKINLLLHQDDHRKQFLFFKFFRVAVIGYSIIVIIALIALYFVNQKYLSDIRTLSQQKADHITQIASKEGEEAKFIYISEKAKVVKSFLDQDTEFRPYYNLLAGDISEASIEASLESFNMDKNRDVAFQIKVSRFSDLYPLLNHVESSSFLNNFHNLALDSIVTQIDQNPSSTIESGIYEITFLGKFKTLDAIGN